MKQKKQPTEGLSITRRQFVIGSAAATMLVVGSTAIMQGCSSDQDDDTTSSVATELDVADEDVLISSEFSELDYTQILQEAASFDIQMGSVAHMDGGNLATVLSPGDTNDVLVKLGLLSISSATLNTVLSQAISKDEGFEIYDARGNSEIIAWVESHFRSDEWRLYIAPVYDSATIGDAILIDEGDYDFDPPMLCVYGDTCWWTYMPYEDGSASDSDSYLKKASLDSTTPQIVFTSQGRMITNPQATGGYVTIVPRANTSSTRYNMTAIDAVSDEVVATQLLPGSMRANTAIYMDGNFIFGIEQNYNYDGGISRFGTYAPIGDGRYVRFNRTPMQTPAKCGKYLIIKSTSSVVGLDLDEQSYFAIPLVSGYGSYGDFLLSTGECERVSVYTQLPATDGSGDGVVRVRSFEIDQ